MNWAFVGLGLCLAVVPVSILYQHFWPLVEAIKADWKAWYEKH